MTFTDDELKRLKSDLLCGANFKDLLPRLIECLEAAEAVCRASSEVVRSRERISDAPRELKILNALEVWRKVRGK